MFSKIFLFLTVLFCVACTNDDDMDTPVVYIERCLGNPTTPFFSQSCDTLNQFNSAFYCEITDLGDYSLSIEAKKYAQLYCQNIGHSLLYESVAGETMELIITDKSYSLSYSISPTSFFCDGDTTRRIAYCLQRETIDIELTSSNNSLQIEYRLATIPDTRVTTNPGAGDVLSIARSAAALFFFPEFQAVIFPGTLSYESSFSQQHHESIELNGKFFNDVLTNESNLIGFINHTYYVNPALGIVGFEDDTNTLYTLVN